MIDDEYNLLLILIITNIFRILASFYGSRRLLVKRKFVATVLVYLFERSEFKRCRHDFLFAKIKSVVAEGVFFLVRFSLYR